MAFELSDDEDLIAKTVAEFAQGLGLDAAAELDRHDGFPAENIAAAAGLGLMGMGLSAEQGGAGITPTAFALAVAELAKVCPNTAAVIGAHNGLALQILQDGPAAVRDAAIAGEVVATLATEEAWGSRKDNPSTAAIPDGDGFRISGTKVWGLAAAGAPHYLVLASAPDGPTWFHVPADAEGVSLGQGDSLLGLRGAGIRTVHFSGVSVGKDAIVGTPGDGLARWQAAQPWMQVAAAAALIGATAGAFEAGRQFAEDRVQFGKPIGTYQAVSDTITDIDMRLAAARSLLLEAAARLGHDDAPLWAARAKAFAVDIAVPLTRKVIRVQGGTGFMREGGSERFARDVRALQFLGEPVVMARDTMKRALLDVPFSEGP